MTVAEQTAAAGQTDGPAEGDNPVQDVLRESVAYWQRRALAAERKLRAEGWLRAFEPGDRLAAALEALEDERERVRFILSAVAAASDGELRFAPGRVSAGRR